MDDQIKKKKITKKKNLQELDKKRWLVEKTNERTEYTNIEEKILFTENRYHKDK